jgi:hypothetical protein
MGKFLKEAIDEVTQLLRMPAFPVQDPSLTTDLLTHDIL